MEAEVLSVSLAVNEHTRPTKLSWACSLRPHYNTRVRFPSRAHCHVTILSPVSLQQGLALLLKVLRPAVGVEPPDDRPRDVEHIVMSLS